LPLATGEFITFLDHDDILAPFALFEIVSALSQHPMPIFYIPMKIRFIGFSEIDKNHSLSLIGALIRYAALTIPFMYLSFIKIYYPR
jgi:hypothetical protein